MKKLICLFLAAVFCASLVSCESMLPGIGDNTGAGTRFPLDTSEPVDWGYGTEIAIDVDWGDFVRIRGITYVAQYGLDETVAESDIDTQIGSVTRHVRSQYSSVEACNADAEINGTASFAPIGSKIYSIRDSKYVVAVLIGGSYRVYRTKSEKFSIHYKVWGYSDYAYMKSDGAVTVNSREALEKILYSPDMINAPELEKFDNDFFNDYTLAVVQLESGWGGTEYGFDYVSKYGDDLKIGMVKLDSSGDGDDAMHTWTYFIAVLKTDDKKVILDVNEVDPATDAEGVSYDEMRTHLNNVDHSLLRVYEGSSLWRKSAVEEMVREKYGSFASIGGLKIRYESVKKYWLVEFIAQSGCLVSEYHLVIRAADGKIIAGDR